MVIVKRHLRRKRHGKSIIRTHNRRIKARRFKREIIRQDGPPPPPRDYSDLPKELYDKLLLKAADKTVKERLLQAGVSEEEAIPMSRKLKALEIIMTDMENKLEARKAKSEEEVVIAALKGEEPEVIDIIPKHNYVKVFKNGKLIGFRIT